MTWVIVFAVIMNVWATADIISTIITISYTEAINTIYNFTIYLSIIYFIS